jgi:hypothetical protein
MAKEKEFKVEVKKNVNQCWYGTAYLLNRKTNKVRSISYAVSSDVRSNSAKPQIRDWLKKECDAMIATNPDYIRITKEEAEDIGL